MIGVASGGDGATFSFLCIDNHGLIWETLHVFLKYACVNFLIFLLGVPVWSAGTCAITHRSTNTSIVIRRPSAGGALYFVRYRPKPVAGVCADSWSTGSVHFADIILSGLEPYTEYEVEVQPDGSAALARTCVSRTASLGRQAFTSSPCPRFCWSGSLVFSYATVPRPTV